MPAQLTFLSVTSGGLKGWVRLAPSDVTTAAQPAGGHISEMEAERLALAPSCASRIRRPCAPPFQNRSYYGTELQTYSCASRFRRKLNSPC